MKNFFVFDDDDRKLWIGIAAVSIFSIIVFSMYWGTGIFSEVGRVLAVPAVVFLPGYVIMKIYLDKLTLSDNKIADKVAVSFGISLGVMVVPFYFLKYFRTYEDNTDEKAWGAISDNIVILILLILVIGIAFGVKHYQNKKNGII